MSTAAANLATARPSGRLSHAVALKRHCSRMASLFGATTPPETFLFRGNAYMQLSKPYFAIADYNTASLFMQLSGQHHERCMRAVDMLPPLLVGEYPSSNQYLDTYVVPFVHPTNATIGFAGRDGRMVAPVATRNATHFCNRTDGAVNDGPAAGSSAAANSPVDGRVTGIGTQPTAYANLFESYISEESPEGGAGGSIAEKVQHMGRGIFAAADLPAGAVAMERHDPFISYGLEDGRCSFCNKELPERNFPCQNDRCHEEYCSRGCRESAKGTYHTKICDNLEFAGIELDLYSKMQTAKAEGNASQFNSIAAVLLAGRVLAIAAYRGIVPSAMPEMRTLGGRIEFEPKTMATDTYDLYRRYERAMKFSTTISFEEFVGVLARINANSFQHGEEKISVYLPRSLFNHSCDGNVAECAVTGNLITSRSVAKGEQLCLNYYPHLRALPYAERSKRLAQRSFYCQCQKCAAKI